MANNAKAKVDYLRHLEVWAVPMTLALLGIFSGAISDTVTSKAARNQAKQAFAIRLTEDLSEYVYNTRTVVKFFSEGWTTKEHILTVATPYNQSIDTLMRREESNAVQLQTYHRPDVVARYEHVMDEVRRLDQVIHRLNDLAVPVMNGELKKLETDSCKDIVAEAEAQIRKLVPMATLLMTDLFPKR